LRHPLQEPIVSLVLLAALGTAALGAGELKCVGTGLSGEELLPRARVALDLAGTDRVGPGAAPGCVAITVRSTGTARLVKLILRGMRVPEEAAEIRVSERPVSLGS
jgi:hypothetical protein